MDPFYNPRNDYHDDLLSNAVYQCFLYSTTPQYYGQICSITWLDSDMREMLRYTPEFGYSDAMKGRHWGSLSGYTVYKSDNGFKSSKLI